MSARPLEAATAAGLEKPVIPLATIIRLDVVGDPLYTWTGLGDLYFAPGSIGDSAIEGITFTGTGAAIDIGVMSEGANGSDVLTLSLAGVDLNEPMMRQIIFNHNRWQFKAAKVWMMLLDPDTNAIAGKPFRIKTGRMDQMPYEEDKKGGIISCKIEGQQSYGKQPLATRYSEQKDINPADVSQDYMYSLANMSAQFGTASALIPSGYQSWNLDFRYP